jgi:EAL domain-containing protein (putative c-di-GMP-specific phosphodiesterase class I)
MPAPSDAWYLEVISEDSGRLERVALEPLPFRLGRAPGSHLTLRSEAVSQRHAEFDLDRGRLLVRDLGSTNGTYVNGRRIRVAILDHGDSLHVANVEFRLVRVPTGPPTISATIKLPIAAAPELRLERLGHLPELLATAAVEPLFQPIVALPAGRVVACEALGRGRHPELPRSPRELFELAAQLGLVTDLDRVFRAAAVAACPRLPAGVGVFFNCRPEEIAGGLLGDAFRGVRERLPDVPLTVEIHESAVTDLATIRAVRDDLAAHRIGLAYDDFGAGQARLVELVEVPPDYVKFDFALVHDIDRAPAAKRRLLASLVAMVADLGIAAVAEGVETAGEAEACRQLGFTHAQGNFFGRPAPATALAGRR